MKNRILKFVIEIKKNGSKYYFQRLNYINCFSVSLDEYQVERFNRVKKIFKKKLPDTNSYRRVTHFIRKLPKVAASHLDAGFKIYIIHNDIQTNNLSPTRIGNFFCYSGSNHPTPTDT